MHNIHGEKGTQRIEKKLRRELVRLQTLYDDPIESELSKKGETTKTSAE